jgi:hypothetical protein
MDGTVFPWVKADSTAAYYENGCNGVFCADLSRFGSMIVGALGEVSGGADSLTVWAQYDNDGPDGLPNSGDDDGRVDFVTFLQPEIDGAAAGHIWAHRWYLEGLNGGSPYVTQDQPPGGSRFGSTVQSGQGSTAPALRPDHADRHGGARDRPRLRPARPLRH